MNKLFTFISLAGTFFLNASQVSAQKKLSAKQDYLITISTEMGDMRFVLSEQTPKHRENFVKLAKEGFYNGLLFHRVIENFMIQGGDPNSKNAKKGEMLGSGSYGERIPAEINSSLYHRKGALAAARDNNPEKASSGCQFYIVDGKKMNEMELNTIQGRTGRVFSDEQKATYQSEGGAPHLDGGYTVFGQLIDGMAVIDKIAAVSVDSRNRPENDVAMKVKAEVWKKKKIKKKFNYQYN